MLKNKLLQRLRRDGTMRVELADSAVNKITANTNNLRKWKRLNSFPLQFIYKEYKELLPSITHVKSGTGRSFSRVKIPENLTEELAYILGAMRDGSLINVSRKHWVRLYDSAESKWIENVLPLFQKTFEVKLHLRYQKQISEKYLDISSKPLFSMITLLVDGKLHKDVPSIIKKANTKIKIAYIAGFFDAEGSVPSPNVKNKRFRISFSQKNSASLNFIRSTLESLGIRPSKVSHYSFDIYGQEKIRKFHTNFNLLNPKKSARLGLLLK